MDQLLQKVQQGGVVGAGGAGFPTYVKLDCQVEYVMANGAECEPLLYKDQVLMQRESKEFFGGMLLAMKQVGAKRGIIGIKKKNKISIDILRETLPDSIELLLMEDVYPAGDEVELIYEAIGKRVPSGGLPKDIGVMVNNIESFINIYKVAHGKAVTETMITVHGEVKNPFTTWVPIGMSYEEAIALAGGITCDDFVIIEGGPMMGSVTTDLTQPVTKISSGLLVIKRDSRVARAKLKSEKDVRRIGKAACDQCSLCTSMCPRALLGYPIQPHLAMRALQVSGENNLTYALAAQACSGCNLCTMWSCPEGLDPSRVCTTTKRELKSNNLWQTPAELQLKTIDVHLLRSYRGVPTKQLVRRLELVDYISIKAEYIDFHELLATNKQNMQRVVIPLSQHIGKPADAVVSVGDIVKKGQIIGQAADDSLSVSIHASIAGKVVAVNTAIEIQII